MVPFRSLLAVDQAAPLPHMGVAHVLMNTLNTTVRDPLETLTKGEFCRAGECRSSAAAGIVAGGAAERLIGHMRDRCRAWLRGLPEARRIPHGDKPAGRYRDRDIVQCSNRVRACSIPLGDPLGASRVVLTEIVGSTAPTPRPFRTPDLASVGTPEAAVGSAVTPSGSGVVHGHRVSCGGVGDLADSQGP